ncbi:hypothetical protein ASG43_19030 [Aureimonas sp. Leaf454]|uniref:response regulator n=1 Tax=Aureimonas sp. Leaf454 TaxID=1736381 RepID=UPI0006F1F6EB|nr:response regulator [Aureimonas sp. Leaf454]KQT53307.1 hypothetical protein ASG43_19030 [Aureimonas sp. Leaf454]
MLTNRTADFTGKNILIVEDEAIIAMEMAQAVKAAGGSVLGPVPSVEGAMDIVHGEIQIDGAILDIRLQDGISIEVAQALKKSGVPIIFVTGYDDWFMPEELEDVPVERKPNDPEDVVRVLFAESQPSD